MSFKVTIASSPKTTFDVEENESILDAAHRAGIDIPSCCENGICATCKGCILKGDVNYPEQEPEGLMEDEAASGQALFCCAHPSSDLVIDHPELLLPGEFPARFFKISIHEKTALSSNSFKYLFKTESKIPFKFIQGQYIELIIGTERFPLTIVNQPGDEFIECHISHSHSTEELAQFADKIDSAEKLMIYGPQGRAYFQANPAGDTVFLAGGGGVTPMLSMLPPALATGKNVYFYWGARSEHFFYQKEQLNQLANDHPQLKLNFTLCDPDLPEHGNYIHEELLKEIEQLNEPTIYMAGPPSMITNAYDALLEKGITREQMHSDAFSYLNI